jgi:hypothetical protein
MSHKIISINPDAFKVKGSRTGTRKKKSDTAEIKVRTPVKKTISNKSSLLKFIRNHQEKNYNELIHPKDNHDNDIEQTDFDNTLQYLMDITKDVEKKETTRPTEFPKNNHTLKHNTNTTSNIVPLMQAPIHMNQIQYTPSSGNSPKMYLVPPKYGCLKGGNLPTYRQYMHNETVKKTITTARDIPENINEPIIGGIKESPEENLLKRFPKISDINEKKNKPIPKVLIYPTQKRTVRRTYKIGKSKIHPKVSVLISNRTIRNNITTKSQLLNQTPIQDVKTFLIKRGLIKVGTIAPNDVLREMYKSTTLLCGDVYNHNPETLLYNFFNEK